MKTLYIVASSFESALAQAHYQLEGFTTESVKWRLTLQTVDLETRGSSLPTFVFTFGCSEVL